MLTALFVVSFTLNGRTLSASKSLLICMCCTLNVRYLVQCRAKLLQEIAKHRETQRIKKLTYPCRTFRKSDVICTIMEAVI